MEAAFSFRDANTAIWTRTRLRVFVKPVLGMRKGRVTVFPLAVILVTRESLVPGQLVSVAHLEVAGATADVLVSIFVELSIITRTLDAPTEVWVLAH
jgi:hypothetical protein